MLKCFLSCVQEVALDLVDQFNCYVVFMGEELKEKYYKGKYKADTGDG